MTPIPALSFLAILATLLTSWRRRLAALLPVALLLAAAPAQAQTFGLRWAQMQVTTGLNDPYGITVDAAGTIFIADGSANQVRKLSPVAGQSALATSVIYDAAATIPADHPLSVSADAHGNLFVCNFNSGTVVELVAASQYAPTQVASGLHHPADAVADGTGRVFIAEFDTGLVKVALPLVGGSGYSATLQNAITAGGTPGDNATAVALDGSSNLYVMEGYIDGGGNPASKVLQVPLGTGFSGPATAKIDPLPLAASMSVRNQELYVVLSGGGHDGEIRVFDTNGNPQSTLAWGLANPIGVAATADGVYYTANGDGKAWRILPDRADGQFGLVALGTGSRSLSLVYECTTPGTLSAGGAQVLTQGQPGLEFTMLGSSTLSAGDTFTANQLVTVDLNFQPTLPGLRRGSVLVRDGAGTLLAGPARLAGTGSGPQLVFPGQLPKPLDAGAGQAFGVAVDAAGNLFYADQAQHQVVKAKPQAGGGYATTAVASGLIRPCGVAVDYAGDVVFTDSGHAGAADGSVQVAKKQADGTYQNPAPVLTGLESPGQLALDAQDNAYVVDSGGNQILQITPIGASQPVMTQANGLTQPTGVAVGEDGEVLITDRTAAGGTLWVAIPLSAGGYHFAALNTDLQKPRGVAFDSTGVIYVADDQRVVKSIVVSGLTVTFGPMAAGMAAPEAVAVDNAGNVIISDPAAASPLLRVDVQDPPVLDFGTLTVGGSATRTVTLLNRGDQDLEFLPQANDSNPAIPAPFTFDASNTFARVPAGAVTPTTLAGGAAIDLTLGYHPTAAAADGGDVVLFTNHLNNLASQQLIHVTGQAVAASTPTLGSTTTLDVTGGTRFGQTVTLTATVTAPAGSTQAPTGTITFMDGSTALGTGPVALVASPDGSAAATATLDLANLAVQDHAFTAVYGGDGTYQGSTSDPKAWTIQAAAVQFAPAGAPGQPLAVTLRGTLPATLDVQVSAQGTLAPGSLTFSVTGLPRGVAATLTPNRVDTASLPATIQVQLTAGSRALARTQPGWVPPLGGGGAAGAFLACGLLALPWARRRRTGLWTGLALLLTLGLVGCWSRSTQAPTTYRASLVATDAAGTTVGSTPLDVTVTP